MEPSIFAQWLTEYFAPLVLRIQETYNGEQKQRMYSFMRFLTPRFSIDGKWETLLVNNKAIVADVIAMDSSIPLKTRPTLGKASGNIPKTGTERAVREQELTEIDTLIALGRVDDAIARVFEDTPAVIAGQMELAESMFLEGLSTGAVELTDTENVGTGIRLDYGYLAANRFQSSVSWDDAANAKPFTDIQEVLDKAQYDGNNVIRVFMDRVTFNRMANTAEGKSIYAAQFGIFSATVPTPTLDQMNNALQARFGFVIDIETPDRKMTRQRDGVDTVYTPWAAGQVVFTTTDNLGSHVYARLAEEGHPVAGVAYQKPFDWMLVSKFRTNRPSLAEFTNSQSRMFPIIDNPLAIYTLDSTQDAG